MYYKSKSNNDDSETKNWYDIRNTMLGKIFLKGIKAIGTTTTFTYCISSYSGWSSDCYFHTVVPPERNRQEERNFD